MTDAEPIRLVGLVADDLTGATDAAVQFAESGWRSMLLRTRKHCDVRQTPSASWVR